MQQTSLIYKALVVKTCCFDLRGDFRMVIEKVLEHKEYVIYGAQVIAFGAYKAIKHLTGIEPKCFVVGESQVAPSYPVGNPDSIDGIQVYSIESITKDMLIVVGVTELIQQEVVPFLVENGFKNVYPLTQHEEHLLMSKYYNSINKFPTV